jgi:hypothetical protein
MKRDPTGAVFIHLGKDGVLRTISGNYEVLDARGLTPEQVKGFVDAMPVTLVQKEEFDGVDGTNVIVQEELFHPPPGILPKNPENDPEAAEGRQSLAEQHLAANKEENGNSR